MVDSMKNICVRNIISGKVQGVWYRASTATKARELGLTGWVRNLADGKVECLACGEAEKVQALQDWFWQGSPASNVTNVESETVPSEEHSSFQQI